MGVTSDASVRAFPSKDVDALIARTRSKIPVDIMGELSPYNTRHVVLAVDPSGGGSSAFACCSMAQLPTGQVVVRARPGPVASCPGPHPPTFPQARKPIRQSCPVPESYCEQSAAK